MTTTSRFRPLLVLGTAALTLFVAGSATTAMDAEGNWAGSIASSVMRDDVDYATIDRTLSTLPDEAQTHAQVVQFRDTYGQHLDNVTTAQSARDEAKVAALGEMRVQLDGGKLSEALRSAVEYQALSEDLAAALDAEEVSRIIDWAERRVPEVEQDRDWLAAQELLFRLRTLYEGTGLHDEYQGFDRELDAVNRRVGLLARYAPARLHSLREARALALGEEPLVPFNPATVVDWRERLDDVDHLMLKTALRIAAQEHIESEGWRPLLSGGLEALQLLVSTPALSEAFPSLSDADKVNRWQRHIENELERLADTPDNHLSSRTFTALLDRIEWMNERTVALPNEVVFHEFGDGAMESLDKFSEIIWPSKLRRFEQSTQGNFVGVGILIRHDEKRDIAVVSPLEGTPAYFAGVKPDDLITEVDGESTVGWSLNDAVDKITGKRGTTVTLGLRREGEEEPIFVDIVRDVIKIRSVKGWWKERLDDEGKPLWDWYLDPVTRIAYVKLTQFTEDTRQDLMKAWDQMSADGKPRGLILDLRYNPGGLLSSAVGISNLFVRNGVIVSGEDKDGERAWPDQKADPRFARIAAADVPIVVLINEGSASASEIVAGCLQAHGAATIVGKRTFGKGSVQTVHHIAREARLKLTTQYYRLPPSPEDPAGRLVHRRPRADVWGVDPDVAVEMTPDQVIGSLELRQGADIIPLDDDGKLDPNSPDRPDVNELLTNGLDPQLEMALLILQAKALANVEEDVRHAMRNEPVGSGS